MTKIIFESHNTSLDNEAKLASGWNDVSLSNLGIQQSKELYERNKDKNISCVYCSDLQRSYNSAKYFKENGYKIIKDKRLRECDYGDLTQQPTSVVNPDKIHRISKPFPNGESFKDCAIRMGSFLNSLKEKHSDNETILIIGHRATQYGLNHHILGESLEKCITDKWSWQPGWEYKL